MACRSNVSCATASKNLASTVFKLTAKAHFPAELAQSKRPASKVVCIRLPV